MRHLPPVMGHAEGNLLQQALFNKAVIEAEVALKKKLNRTAPPPESSLLCIDMVQSAKLPLQQLP